MAEIVGPFWTGLLWSKAVGATSLSIAPSGLGWFVGRMTQGGADFVSLALGWLLAGLSALSRNNAVKGRADFQPAPCGQVFPALPAP